MAGVEESNRRRIAVVLALMGGGLILAGLALGVHQFAQTEAAQPQTGPGVKPVADARAIRSILFLLLILVGVFGVASLAFLRWSRSFRRWLLRKPSPATPDGDVWSMHRLPEDALGEDFPPREGAGPAEGGRP